MKIEEKVFQIDNLCYDSQAANAGGTTWIRGSPGESPGARATVLAQDRASGMFLHHLVAAA